MALRGIDEELLALAVSEPERALDEVDEALAQPIDDPAVHARVLRAGGLAARNTGDLARSNGYLEPAVAIAERSGSETALVEVQVTRAGNLLLAGDPERALALLQSLGSVDDPSLAAKVEIQIGTLYARTSRFDDALEFLTKALAHAREAKDRRQEAGILKNVGLLRAYNGDHVTATSDLTEARSIFEEIGIELEAAYCLHNLGLVAVYSGDLPAAFNLFSVAEETIARLSGYEWEVQVGRVEALLSAGLAIEAVAFGTDLADNAEAADHQLERGEALRAVAQAHFLLGRYADAHRLATELAQLFERHGRLGWRAYAQLLALRSGRAAGLPTDEETASTLVRELTEARLHNAELEARIEAAEVLAASDPEAASARLRALRPRLRNAPADLRLAERTALARARLRANDPAGANRAARETIEMLLDYQKLLGAGDLRVGAALYVSDAGEIGLGLALESGKPRRVFDWLERTKAGALRHRGILPERDEELRAGLTELRSMRAVIDQSAPDDALATARHQRAEQKVIDRYRAIRSGIRDWRPIRAADVLNALEARTVISYGELEGESFAVKLANDRARLIPLGPSASILRAIRSARADLRRVAAGLAEAPPADGLAALDALLVAPLGNLDEAVTVVPTPDLFGVPWGALPGLRDRPFAVAPNATLAFADRGQSGDQVVLAAGPGLEEGEREVAEISDRLGAATVLTGDAASRGRVLDALAGASIAHIAAHGHIRIDNPLFSSLDLADGPLNVYELETLDHRPSVVVLSACHIGLPAAQPGRELLGLVGALLGLGTQTVIASTLPLPDTPATTRYMVDLHGAMAEGQAPAAAALSAQRAAGAEAMICRAALTVFGTG